MGRGVFFSMAERGVVNKVSFSMVIRVVVKKVGFGISEKRRGQKVNVSMAKAPEVHQPSAT
jgi:hypothetical protein